MSEGTKKESIFKKLLPSGRLGGGFPFFIAKRYILSKKSTNAINIISGISVVGVAIATMALVVVLSVFNGFHDMVASMLTNFDPQLEIVPVKGKTIVCDDPIITKIKSLDDIEVSTECIEEMAMAVYNDKMMMVTMKGVEDSFSELTHIEDILYGRGDFCLHAGVLEYGIPGIVIAQQLGTDANWQHYMRIYAPQREGQLDMSDPESGFELDSLAIPGVVFAVGQAKCDKKYVLCSINFARRLFNMQGEMSNLELRIKPKADFDKVKSEIKRIAGDKYQVLDRFEQQADTFRIMQIEKILAYVFLTFILIVACFNIIGSISMLIIDKKNDVETLRYLGANDSQISRIFLYEGRIISSIGAVIGIVLGLLLCLMQQQFGFVKMGNGANYVINAYPVSVHYMDVIVVFITVIIVGWLAVWYPVRYMSRRLLEK